MRFVVTVGCWGPDNASAHGQLTVTFEVLHPAVNVPLKVGDPTVGSVASIPPAAATRALLPTRSVHQGVRPEKPPSVVKVAVTVSSAGPDSQSLHCHVSVALSLPHPNEFLP